MSDLAEQIARLSPEKRELLLHRLGQAGTRTGSGGGNGGVIPRLGRETAAFPLSYAQERIWFTEQLNPGTPIFNLDAAIELGFPVVPAVLEQALGRLVARHESLRTSFHVQGEQPVQVVSPACRLALDVVDLRDVPEPDRSRRVDELATEEARLPFDLERPPLLRARLLRLAERKSLLLLTQHHVISDGWSMGILLRELGVVYEALLAGREPALPELRIQYADYAVWQRQWLQGETLRRQLDYWTRQLAGAPELALPADRPRPAVPTFRGGRHVLHVPAEVAAGVHAFNQASRATLFMTLLAGFVALLERYTGSSDLVVGSYHANRGRAEIEHLVGFFVNTLVLRVDASGDPGFGELVRRTQEVALGAYAHQDMPFSRLVAEIQPDRDLARNPLFQVVFQLFNVPTVQQQEPGSPEIAVYRETAMLDLVVTMVENGHGLSGGIQYSLDLFEPGTIERLAGHFRTLLGHAVRQPAAPLSALPLLPEEERRQIVVEWNRTGRDFDLDRPLIDLFRERARAAPAAVAFRDPEGATTYGEIEDRSARLAAALAARGAGPERVVGICLPRTRHLASALLGVWRSGAAFLPLDPSYPAERLRFMLEDSGAELVVTDRAHAELSGFPPERLTFVEELWDAPPAPEAPSPALGPGALAYVIYTSGSTGRPKGVAVDQAQIQNRLGWMWESVPFEPGEVCCQKTAFSFVDSIWELLGPLLQGVPTVVIPDDTVRDPAALIPALREAGVTRLWLVPSLLRAMLEHPADLARELPRLATWVSSGEDLPAGLSREFRRRLPHARLFNLYGTSEVWDATWPDPGIDPEDAARPSIGKPIANTEAYVLDPHLRPVPIGVPGELHIGGLGLARGYLNLPELTACRFIPHPFAAGARLYRTGDLARLRPDGNLEWLGRLDRQIKVRGFRVEPGEIEEVLAECPAVQQAAVVAGEDGGGGPSLDAYVVLRPGAAADSTAWKADLAARLAARLPGFLQPSSLTVLDAFPLTPSGKIDRARLPSPRGRLDALCEPVPPGTETEIALEKIWSAVLKKSGIGIHDDFFRVLGGHSLLAVGILSRIRGALGVELPLRAFFEAPTIARLARHVEGLRGPERAAPARTIRAVPRTARLVPAAGSGGAPTTDPTPLEEQRHGPSRHD